jgi:MYXO-CTERM domain-containing protein
MVVYRALVPGVLLCLLSAPALASQPQVESPDQDPLISNAPAAENCQWPTTVALFAGGGLCTGTLVHPQIVVTAAHCGFPGKISFGESVSSPAREVAVDHCMRNPEYSSTNNNGVNGDDFAYCKLAQPIYDIPITPPVYGCETTILRINQAATMVGFGNNSGTTGAGIKRWSESIIQTNVTADSTTVVVGASGNAACSGDSGGPAFVQYPDGSWHTFGIVSGGPPCGQGADVYALVHRAVPFIEENSGIDITPCHDRDGTWNPTPACQGFAVETLETSVTWPNWCATPLLGASETCGPAFNAEPDDIAPQVAILDPLSGTTYPGPEASINIEIDAFDEGHGVKEVRLLINGDVVATDLIEPYRFANATFPTGGWLLVAEAEDWAGNVTESEPVAIGVGQDAPALPGAEPEPDPDAGTEDGGTGGGFGLPVDGSAGGCACATASNGPARGAGALALLVLLGLRRRRAS